MKKFINMTALILALTLMTGCAAPAGAIESDDLGKLSSGLDGGSSSDKLTEENPSVRLADGIPLDGPTDGISAPEHLNEDEPVIENPIDDSVISDPIPSDENNYIKESTDADVVYDEYGFPYIKNQIVLLTDLGTEKQIIEKMVSEMDADIVGYIQSVCFYQIEFRSDKSSEELEELIELIEGHEYIMYAGLNSVDEEGQPNSSPNDTFYYD